MAHEFHGYPRRIPQLPEMGLHGCGNFCSDPRGPGEEGTLYPELMGKMVAGDHRMDIISRMVTGDNDFCVITVRIIDMMGNDGWQIAVISQH